MRPGNFLGRLWAAAVSRNMAIVLLVVITGMLALGAILPNPALMSDEDSAAILIEHPRIYWLGERYNSQKLAGGYFFGFLGVALVLSTAFCSIDRIVTRYKGGGGRKVDIPERPPSTGGKKATVRNVAPEMVAGFLKDWLGKKRMRVASSTDGPVTTIAAERGSVGFWGSTFFHFVLITALVGLVAYYLGGYRGVLLFTEGQSYALQKESFSHIEKEPLWGLKLPRVRMELLRQRSIYDSSDPWYPIDYVAHFRVTRVVSGKSWEKDIRINDPLVIDGKKFLLTAGGFSPRLVVNNPSGTKVFDSFVALKEDSGTKDDFAVPGEGLSVYVKFHPDFVMTDGKPGTRSLQLKNPFIELRVHGTASVLYKGQVPIEGTATAGGYTVDFPDVRRWVTLELVGEPGIGFFFIASFGGLLGLALRMIDPEEKLYVFLRHEGDSVEVEVFAFSKHFPGLLTERAEMLLSAAAGLAGADSEAGHKV